MAFRSCISCRKVSLKEELLRFVAPGGHLEADLHHLLGGRGAYLCKRVECLERVLGGGSKGLGRMARALKVEGPLDLKEGCLEELIQRLDLKADQGL